MRVKLSGLKRVAIKMPTRTEKERSGGRKQKVEVRPREAGAHFRIYANPLTTHDSPLTKAPASAQDTSPSPNLSNYPPIRYFRVVLTCK